MIGTETWHGPLPDDPPPPPTLGGSFDGPGGVTAVQGRRLAEEESTRAAEALPSAARTFESMLGTHPAAVKSRRDYIRALEEFHRQLTYGRAKERKVQEQHDTIHAAAVAHRVQAAGNSFAVSMFLLFVPSLSWQSDRVS